MQTTLNKLPTNLIGKIIKLEVNETLKRRLQDLGLIENTKIKSVYKSPLNDPKAYLIRESVIALRNEDAKHIFISYENGDINGIN